MLIIHPQVKSPLAIKEAIRTGSREIEIPVEDGSISSNGIKVSRLIVKAESVTLDNGVRVTGKITRVILDVKSWFEGGHHTA
jgi:hypothetical protein